MALKRNDVTAVGLQYAPAGIQMTIYNNSMREPGTVGADPDDSDNGMIPLPQEAVREAEGITEGTEALSAFLKEQFTHILDTDDFSMLRIMVTIPENHDSAWEKMPGALLDIGVERKHIYLQDYLSSFYFYSVNQKKDLWNQDVALLEFEGGEMIGYVLSIDRTKSPAVALVQQCASTRVDESLREGRNSAEWDREKDRLFFEFLKRVFERRSVGTCYLLSDFYDKSWAKRSFQYLCYHRRAFQGKNLYTRGACYAAMERAKMLVMPPILFLGKDIVKQNLGMYMRVRGKSVFYSLISAGVNWYEAHFECEMVPDHEDMLTLISTPLEEGEPVAHILRLDHMPKRPDRATRLALSVYFVSPYQCRVECEDLGFGEMYRSSGKKWTRMISFS